MYAHFADQPDASPVPPSKNVDSWGERAAPNTPIGKQYEATVILQRLKYLETILNAPNISPESIREAQREKTQIFNGVAD